jgi:F-type H+-transporting ATPase subunit gamma
MAQLIQMRRRIKAIETIKKITHAMRLIAMSTHLRLRAKKNTVDFFNNEITSLFAHLSVLEKKWDHPLLKKQKSSGKTLVILVGSQKGLCGNFNTALCAFFERELLNHAQEDIEIIAVGKKISEYLQKKSNIIKEFNEFNTNNLQAMTQAIINHIVNSKVAYSSVILYSNISKSFFTQKPQQATLIPLSTQTADITPSEDLLSEYVWEQTPEEIMNFVIDQLLYNTLYYILFQSLIAEQASRFIAMDNSTRNASKLLDTMRLNYNKLRQSKITRELTDLAGSFF